MSELKACPFCGKPFIFAEITDPGIELRHESDECPMDGFIGWFSSKEQAINSKWFQRPIEDALKHEIDIYDKVCTEIRNVLTSAGIPELTDDRLSVIPLVERVKMPIYTTTSQSATIAALKEDAIALAEDYCQDDEQNHSKNCPRGLLGKRYAKINGHECDPCNCGYEAKYKRHNDLMKELDAPHA